MHISRSMGQMHHMGNSKRKNADVLDRIKRLAVIAMFSDDTLLDKLVPKGGNALDLVLGVTTRASIDLDFSIEHAFGAMNWSPSDAASSIG